jgi:hypothetical protein
LGSCVLPKVLRRQQRIDIELLPPREFVTALVKLAMVRATERHREFVAYLSPQGALLCSPEMMCIRRAATAGEAGLGAYELKMIAVAQPKRLSAASKLSKIRLALIPVSGISC